MQIWQEALTHIQNIYGLIDQLNLSVSGLLAAILVFALALMFAVREMASWFFKVNDIKRDLARLHEITLQLEGELKLVQNLVLQVAPAARAAAQVEVVAVQEVPKKEGASVETPAAEAASGTSRGFPIVH